MQRTCAEHVSTVTKTSFVDCGGCELRVRSFGVGIVSARLTDPRNQMDIDRNISALSNLHLGPRIDSDANRDILFPIHCAFWQLPALSVTQQPIESPFLDIEPRYGDHYHRSLSLVAQSVDRL